MVMPCVMNPITAILAAILSQYVAACTVVCGFLEPLLTTGCGLLRVASWRPMGNAHRSR